MNRNKGEKLNKAQSQKDIQDFQDQIMKIDKELRDIRIGMQEKNLEFVELKVGTFAFYLNKLREIAIDWKGEFHKQIVRKHAKETKERIANTLKDHKKKH